MAIRKIIQFDDGDTLRKRSRKVDRFDARLHTLLDDMRETMYDADGAGLAAPQVGILKRVVVIDVGDGLIEFINPEIIASEGAEQRIEGCLSLKGRKGIVERPAKVRARAQNRDGEEFEIEGEGFLAVAICHELDHLDGVLYTDKMIRDVTDEQQDDAEDGE